MSTDKVDSIDTETENQEEFKLHLRFGKYQVRRTDNFNIVVEEIKVTKEGANVGSEYFLNLGYYKRLQSALEKVLQLSLETKSLKSLTDVIESLKEAQELLYRELDSKYKDIEER